MTIDIIYSGFPWRFFVKRRTKKFFNSTRFIVRNNVFVDIYNNNTYHIKKNSIHMFISTENSSSIIEIGNYLKFIFKESTIGIRANESICNKFYNICLLNLLRM